MTEEKLHCIIDQMAKRKRLDCAQYLRWYNDVCERHPDDPFSIWLDIIRYSNFWDFPQETEKEVHEILISGTTAAITDYFLEFKYPDLINLFAFRIVSSDKGVDVLPEVMQREKTEYREYAIYALLYNAFYKDKDQNIYELPNYLSAVTQEYFVMLFFNEFYNYRGKYADEIYERILSDIVMKCDLVNTYLKENIGSLLVLIERGFALLNTSQKRILLDSLDTLICSYSFTFGEYGEAEDRVVKARKKLMLDVYHSDVKQAFDDEISSFMVRLEGWNVPTEDLSTKKNGECVVLLSWLHMVDSAGINTSLQETILRSIYRRLQQQLKLSVHLDAAYRVAMWVFIQSIPHGSPLYDEFVSKFIDDTDDLYYVMTVIDGMEQLDAPHRNLLEKRWMSDNDTTLIKTRQMNLWADSVNKLVNRLGLQ